MDNPDDSKKPKGVLRKGADWENLRVYQKADAVYQLTFVFCRRFLPQIGDRTVDQMVQAARSGKQNIVEGSEDGKTSTEMELKLINVAQGSIDELKDDYTDYIQKHHVSKWEKGHPRYQQMQEYTKTHNKVEDYLPFAEKWTLEEFCNVCLTLCYQLDAMFNKYLKYLEKTFVEEGGIKERMYAARTGYRKGQDEKMKVLESENAVLRKENEQLKVVIEKWKGKYEDLKNRALKAYYKQQDEIKELKGKLG